MVIWIFFSSTEGGSLQTTAYIYLQIDGISTKGKIDLHYYFLPFKIRNFIGEKKGPFTN